jgi:hypothetical protein
MAAMRISAIAIHLIEKAKIFWFFPGLNVAGF